MKEKRSDQVPVLESGGELASRIAVKAPRPVESYLLRPSSTETRPVHLFFYIYLRSLLAMFHTEHHSVQSEKAWCLTENLFKSYVFIIQRYLEVCKSIFSNKGINILLKFFSGKNSTNQVFWERIYYFIKKILYSLSTKRTSTQQYLVDLRPVVKKNMMKYKTTYLLNTKLYFIVKCKKFISVLIVKIIVERVLRFTVH